MADEYDKTKSYASYPDSKIPKPPIGIFVTPKSILKPKSPDEAPEYEPQNKSDESGKSEANNGWSSSLSDEEEEIPKLSSPMAKFVDEMMQYDDDSPIKSKVVKKDYSPYDEYVSHYSKYGKSESKYSKDGSFIEMTTDGLTYEDTKTYVYSQKNSANGIKQCNICTRYFPDMIIAEQFDGGSTCWHCLFYLNGDDMSRIEDMYQISLENYIEFCGPMHKVENCVRSDSCILCLSNNNIPKTRHDDPNKIDRFIDNIENGVVDKQLDNEIEFGITI